MTTSLTYLEIDTYRELSNLTNYFTTLCELYSSC